MDLSKGVTPLQSVASWAYACMHADEHVPLAAPMHTQALLSPTLLHSDTLRVTPPGMDERVPPGVTEQTEESGDSEERN